MSSNLLEREPTHESPDERASRFHSGVGAVTLLTVAAAILRIYDLSSKSLWYDETATAARMASSPHELLHILAHGEINMSLYYVLMYGWTWCVGASEFMLRFPSAIFGAATVPLLFLLGAELRDRSTGIIAALLLTVNATCISYAQDARSYTLYVALVTLGSVFFVRMMKGRASNNFVGYILNGALSIYAHLFGIMIVPAQALSLLVFRPSRKTVLYSIAAFVAVIMLGSGAFLFAISGDRGNLNWVPPTSFNAVISLLFTFSGDFTTFANELVWRPGILSALLFGFYALGLVLALVWAQREEWPALNYLLLTAFVPIAITAALSHFKPIFIQRYMLAELPPFVLLSAIGLRRLRPQFMIPVVMVFALASLAQDYVYYQSPALEDWRGLIEYVASHSNRGDLMLIFPAYFQDPVNYYVSHLEHPENFPRRIVSREYRKLNALAQPEKLLDNSSVTAGAHIWVTTGFPIDEQAAQLIFPKERMVEAWAFGAAGAAHLVELEKTE